MCERLPLSVSQKMNESRGREMQSASPTSLCRELSTKYYLLTRQSLQITTLKDTRQDTVPATIRRRRHSRVRHRSICAPETKDVFNYDRVTDLIGSLREPQGRAPAVATASTQSKCQTAAVEEEVRDAGHEAQRSHPHETAPREEADTGAAGTTVAIHACLLIISADGSPHHRSSLLLAGCGRYACDRGFFFRGALDRGLSCSFAILWVHRFRRDRGERVWNVLQKDRSWS